MKPSVKRGKKKKKRKPSSPYPPQPAAPGVGDASQVKEEEVGGEGGAEEEEVEEEKVKSLAWLIDAFADVSLDQITSAHREAGGDPYKAAGILGAQLEDPEEAAPGLGAGIGKKKGFESRKQKRVAASAGMVTNVIGKGYSRSASTCGEGKGSKGRMYSSEEAEEFLCSMLGDSSELGMGVVKDVLGQCGCDVEKALDALLDISASSYSQFITARGWDNVIESSVSCSGIYPDTSCNDRPENTITAFQLKNGTSGFTDHPSEREHESLQNVGYDCREYSKVVADSGEQLVSGSGTANPDLQQKVLESLFEVPDYSKHEPNSMNWKKVVKQVQSFGQGLEFSFAGPAEPLLNASNGKDDYQVCRSVAQKHWDTMRNYYQKAAVAYSRGERAHAGLLSERGKFYSKLAREADEKASREIFEARNKDIKNIVTIDLHGQHVKPAIGLLKLHLLLFRYTPSIQFLKVITGRGSDGAGKGRLKRSVIGLVEKEGIEWWEENMGTIVLRLDGPREYSFVECDSDSE